MQFVQTPQYGMKPTLSLLLLLFMGTISWAQETYIINWHPGVDAQLNIKVGDTVKWYVSEAAIVDINSDLALPDFGSKHLIGQGSLYAYTFKKPGKVDFYSSTFPKSMRGSINVQNSQKPDDTSFKIYPNPVKDRIYLDGAQSKNLEITVYDVLGKVVKKDKLSAFTVKNGIDVSALKRGVYLVQIDNGSTSLTQKLIKN